MSVPPALGKEGIWSYVSGQHRLRNGVFLFPFPNSNNLHRAAYRTVYICGGSVKHPVTKSAGVSIPGGSGVNH